MITIGVDQGLSGGICFLTGLADSSVKVVTVMPVRKVNKGRVDSLAVKVWLNSQIREYGRPDLVVIEKSQAISFKSGKTNADGEARHGQGVSSAHTQGFNAGIIVGIFETLGFSIEEPAPQTWKAAVLSGFAKKDKEAMIAVCRRRFPSLSLLATERCTKLHDGMADAVGLALYGQMRLGKIPK